METIKTDDLDWKISGVIRENPTLWHEIKKTHVPPFKYNPYAYVDMGNILSNGLHEKCNRTYVVYYDGSIIMRSHSL